MRELLRSGSRLHAVPPWTDARHHLVVAVHHLDRPAIAAFGILQPQRAGLGLVLGRQPSAVVAPHAGTFLALIGLPGLDVDRTRAPAVFDHERRRRPAIERGDEVAGVPAERGRDSPRFAQRNIVALSDIVEAEQLHHQVMHRVLAGLDEGEAVVARN